MKVSEQFERDIENALINVFMAKRDGLPLGFDMQSYCVKQLIDAAKELYKEIDIAEKSEVIGLKIKHS